jgi:mercuric ion transport protein
MSYVRWNKERLMAPDDPGTGQVRVMVVQPLLTAAGLLGALAASSCCVVPLALFALGISGAWIGNLTQLAPYQPYFIAATVACLAGGYWLLHRSRRAGCVDGEVCARRLPRWIVNMGLVVATILVIGALAVDLLALLFL